MTIRPILAMVRKDLRLSVGDPSRGPEAAVVRGALAEHVTRR